MSDLVAGYLAADNLCKPVGPRSDPKGRASADPNYLKLMIKPCVLLGLILVYTVCLCTTKNVRLLPPNNLCKHVVPRSGPTSCDRPDLDPNCLHTDGSLNGICPTKRIENSKLAVGFTAQFLCESSLFAEVNL